LLKPKFSCQVLGVLAKSAEIGTVKICEAMDFARQNNCYLS
jgi:hypothetical protein